MRISIIVLAIFWTFNAVGQKNLLDHPEVLNVVKSGLYFIYNTESEQAEKYIQQVEQSMPEHPVGSMMRALNINWSSNPIEADTKEFRKLIGYLQLSLDRTEKYLAQDQDNLEAIFFAMAIHSWLAQFYDEGGQTFKALNAAKKAYHYMKIGFGLLDENPEFYFSTGLYNYYRVQYPESNPVYKPFVWVFREGDKALGLQQLDHASFEAVFTKAEALMYLAHIYLRYEDNPGLATRYSGRLVKMYPKNTFFKVTYTEALLAQENYDGAITIIKKLLTNDKDFYRMSGEIFYGIYLENQQRNYAMAKDHYLAALTIGETLGARSDNKKSLAYAGLARIAHKNGDTQGAKDYYRKAMKLAQYDQVKKEGKSYIRAN